MTKRIAILSRGYVGIFAAGPANFGNTMVAADTDRNRFDSVESGKLRLYELGIEDYRVKNGAVAATTPLWTWAGRS